MEFSKQKGVGACGLACALCGATDCPGCAVGGDCSVKKCAAGKGLGGCCDCAEYPCDEKMLQGKRNKAFNRYAREFGKDALLERLRVNFESGITYHTPDKAPGDYDKPETEEEIYRLLRYGRNDPYARCPEFETEHMKFRQVREEDAEELLHAFYGDLSEWMFYGQEMTNRIFASRHATVDEMRRCISVWLDEYRNKYYIRFSVIDKTTKKAIGTIEVFNNAGSKDDSYLHIDLSAPYETQQFISELLALADKELFKIFNIKNLLIQAVPAAKERIAALQTYGYRPYECKAGGIHYYMKRSPAHAVE